MRPYRDCIAYENFEPDEMAAPPLNGGLTIAAIGMRADRRVHPRIGQNQREFHKAGKRCSRVIERLFAQPVIIADHAVPGCTRKVQPKACAIHSAVISPLISPSVECFHKRPTVCTLFNRLLRISAVAVSPIKVSFPIGPKYSPRAQILKGQHASGDELGCFAKKSPLNPPMHEKRRPLGDHLSDHDTDLRGDLRA